MKLVTQWLGKTCNIEAHTVKEQWKSIKLTCDAYLTDLLHSSVLLPLDMNSQKKSAFYQKSPRLLLKCQNDNKQTILTCNICSIIRLRWDRCPTQMACSASWWAFEAVHILVQKQQLKCAFIRADIFTAYCTQERNIWVISQTLCRRLRSV